MSVAIGTPLRVVEISSGIAGAYCGWLLQQMGAEVLRLGALSTPADVAIEQANPIALALAYYAADKRMIDSPDAAGAIADADMIITDDAPRLEAMVGCSLADLAAGRPGTVFGATSVFGLTGPLAGLAAVPIDAQAEAGVAWALGEQGRSPLAIPPGVLDCQAGAHLAAACLMARLAGPLTEGGRPGSGRIVDIALNDVLTHYLKILLTELTVCVGIMKITKKELHAS